MPPKKKRPLTNARLSDAFQTLNAKPLMGSALVSKDSAVLKQTALQQTWLRRKGVKV